MEDRNFLVWSNEHQAYWGWNHCGYTLDDALAGRYTLADAVAICHQANGRQDWGVPPETIVPVSE